MYLILTALFSSFVFASNFVPKTFSGRYEESQKSLISGKIKIAIGSIDYKYPSNFRLDVLSEPKITFVTNKNTTWYYTPAVVSSEQGQVTISKSGSLPITRFFDSVQNGLEGSKIFTMTWEGQNLKLVFNPQAQKDFSLKEVVLHSIDNTKSTASIKNFNLITLIYTSGSTTNIKFTEFKEGVLFTQNHFVFNVPPKTKQTKN